MGLGTAALLLCLAAPLQGGDAVCRERLDPSIAGRQWVVHAARNDLVTVDFSYAGAEVLVHVNGRVCDAGGNRLPGVAVRLVKYVATAEAKGAPPSASDLARASSSKYDVVGSRATVTSDRGDFSFLAVDPASYALQIDWREVPDGASHVVIDLGWSEGVGLQKAYTGR